MITMITTIFSRLADITAQYFAVFYAPVFAFWLIIHSNIDYWRSMGKRTYWIACLVWPAITVPLLIYKDAVFAVRLPTSWWTTVLGLACLALGIRFIWLASRVISRRTMVGLPELEPQKNVQPLLDTGIYSRTRNPLYFMHSILIVAFALLSGFAANWVLLALDLVLMPLTIRAEERELIRRYGTEYTGYMRRVPRFFPKWPW